MLAGNHVYVYFPFDYFDCKTLNLSLIVMLSPTVELNLKTIQAELETLQYCHFDLKYIENVTDYMSESLYNTKMSIYDWEGDAKKLRMHLQIDGIPLDC